MKKNLAVMISGQGTNLEVFLQNKEKFQDIFVVSSKPNAYGLTRAKNHKVPTMILEKEINWENLNQELQNRNIDLIFLAGFMRIIPKSFVEKWQGKLYNLHPSMLPKYKGLKAIEQAIKAKDDVGVTIHEVVPEVDSGKILLQEIAIPQTQLANLTLEDATKRVQTLEHQLVQTWINTNT